jgi:hypothetical protein
MKKIYTLIIGFVLSTTFLNSQIAPPQALSFKATIIGENGQPLILKTVNIRISIQQDDNQSTIPAFSEYFNSTTSSFGQVDLKIGRGTPISGDFSNIKWSVGSWFLKVEVDSKLKSNYVLLSITELLSVPYALYAGGSADLLTEAEVENYIANDINTGYVAMDNGTKLVSSTIYNNGTKVGIGTPNPSGALEITSTTSGFVMPRMTTAQRIAIVSPVEGMQVYDTDLKGFYFFNGIKWDCYSVPAGTVNYSAGNTPPAGYLKCDGAQVSRTKYPELFAAIGTIYGEGDGSSTFNLPDLRGEFIRGLDDGRNVDEGRDLGSEQMDQIQGHGHIDLGHTHSDAGHTQMGYNLSYGSYNNYEMGGNGYGSWISYFYSYVWMGYANILSANANISNPKNTEFGLVRYGTETRPRNVALMACIKY